MAEIDLLINYPKTKRNIHERGQEKTEDDRMIGRQFGKEYFDGDRCFGYGGYNYNARFWQPVMPTLIEHFGLTKESTVLDVGSGKGFMLYDLTLAVPGIKIRGIDLSSYAVALTLESIKPFVQIGNAKELPFADKSFDVVISINTVHNLPLADCKQSLREIQRVARKGSFVTMDAYRTLEEKERMDAWNLTALTYMHVDAWKELFREVGYTGDFYWFIP